jgi:uncharacterized repeat protein (TIGR01451 family)
VSLGVTRRTTGSAVSSCDVLATRLDPGPGASETRRGGNQGLATKPGSAAAIGAEASGRLLKVRKVDRHDPISVGRLLRYRITVKNRGPESATGMTLIDRLPSGTTFVSAVARRGSCSEAAGTVTCDLGSVRKHHLKRVRIVVMPTVPGLISNTAEVSANEADPDVANNQATATTTVR